ncbi:DUF1636 domain-containing protein [Rubrimonas sp.]|uniref:DUF1636 domain-containing protein n=1 Tax=Rubrimonas sp. TaxID=2036015 RepID=UPI002FDE1BBD
MRDHPSAVELLVCTRCRLGDVTGDEDVRPGAVLYRQLADAAIQGVTVTPVECLSNCSRGCTIALRGPGRWTYVYGGLQPCTDLDTIAAGADKYRQAPDGLVPWRERPEHFRKNCIARIPPLDPPVRSLGET